MVMVSGAELVVFPPGREAVLLSDTGATAESSESPGKHGQRRQQMRYGQGGATPASCRLEQHPACTGSSSVAPAIPSLVHAFIQTAKWLRHPASPAGPAAGPTASAAARPQAGWLRRRLTPSQGQSGRHNSRPRLWKQAAKGGSSGSRRGGSCQHSRSLAGHAVGPGGACPGGQGSESLNAPQQFAFTTPSLPRLPNYQHHVLPCGQWRLVLIRPVAAHGSIPTLTNELPLAAAPHHCARRQVLQAGSAGPGSTHRQDAAHSLSTEDRADSGLIGGEPAPGWPGE